MADLRIRTGVRGTTLTLRIFCSEERRRAWRSGATHFAMLIVAATAAAITALATGAPAGADSVAYLVNVTVRPGYNFSNADSALSYGYGVCNRVVAGQSYASLIHHVAADFGTSDDYQAAYLVNQAVNELCPQSIWQLRRSAAGFRTAPE